MVVVRIWVDPIQEATIFLNGDFVGETTPNDGIYIDLPLGEHTIEARSKSLWQFGSVNLIVDQALVNEFRNHTVHTGDAYTILIPVEKMNVVAAHSTGCNIPTNYSQPYEAPCSPDKSYLCAPIVGQCMGSINGETEPYLWQCTKGVWKVVQLNSPYCGAPSAPCESGVPEVCSAERNEYADAYKIYPCKGGHYSSNYYDSEVYGANTRMCQGPGPRPTTGVQWGLWGNASGKCVAGTKKCIVEDGVQQVDKEGYPVGSPVKIRKLYTCNSDGSWSWGTKIGDVGPCAGYPVGETYLTPPPYTTEVPITGAPVPPTIAQVMKAANGGRTPSDVIEYGDRYVFKALGGTATIMKVPGESSGVTGALKWFDPEDLMGVLGLQPDIVSQVDPVETTITTYKTPLTHQITTLVTTEPESPATTTVIPYPPSTSLTTVTTTQTPLVYTQESQIQTTAQSDIAPAPTLGDNLPLLVGAAAVVIAGLLLLKK